ncbi:MAG TPA: hypothetical protein VK680_05600 [Solirubrobacteraceae bacterium]|jgi:hypothetical protein|nr:hypothetical protein [Solirubrobacteraceae bacterium]
MAAARRKEADSTATIVGSVPAGGVLLAVGLPKGVVTLVQEGKRDATAWVRAGGRSCPLIPEVWAVWLAALRPRTRAELLVVAEAGRVEDPEAAIGALEAARLLLRIDPSTVGSELADVRIQPIALGAGTVPERNGVYQVTDMKTSMQMDSIAFGLWSEWDGLTTVAQAAMAVAERFKEVSPAFGIDEAAVLGRVPPLLVALMAARYVFLDRPIDYAYLAE